MTIKSKRLRQIVGEEEKLATASSNTKLYADDWEEVQRRCVGGRTESAELRDLVHSGLQRERYRQAANDPAMRTLLRTFDEMIEHRLTQVQARLIEQMAVESDVVNLYFMKVLPFLMFGGRALLAHLGKSEPSDDPAELKKFYTEMAQKIVEEAKVVTQEIFQEREEMIARLDGPIAEEIVQQQ
jgi:hypothetical protein